MPRKGTATKAPAGKKASKEPKPDKQRFDGEAWNVDIDALPEAKPEPEPEVEEPVLNLAKSVYEAFIEIAGWGGGSSDKAKAFAEMDELIAKYEQMIAQLKQQKLDFDTREEKAQEFIRGMIKLFGPTATEEAIMNALRVKYDLPTPKRKITRKVPLEVDPEKLQLVLDVLDGEGMTSGEIRKALPAGQDMDSAMLRVILEKLMSDKKVAREGTGRGSKYKRLDVNAPEPPSTPEPEPEPESEPEDNEDDDDDDGDGEAFDGDD